MKNKRVLCPSRLRQLPPHWSWVDHHLVREEHVGRCDAPALALYLFLVCVADAQGLSCYSDRSICQRLHWEEASLVAARRQLSFFVMVFCYSRMLYVEFTLPQALEHFLACHQRAFEYFGAVPLAVMVDNAKTAVLERPLMGVPVFNPRYLDLAHHYGFEIKACGVRKPHEKGRVENAALQTAGEAEETIAWTITAHFAIDRFGFCQDFLLQGEIRVEVDLGCFDGFVAQPQRDHGSIDSSLH